MECMHDLRPHPEVSLPRDPPPMRTLGRLFVGYNWQPQGVERRNVYVLQPTQVAKGKHHNDQRAPKVVLPDKVTHVMHPASDMEGEQT